jgi:hypothetical protein
VSSLQRKQAEEFEVIRDDQVDLDVVSASVMFLLSERAKGPLTFEQLM